MKSTTSLYIALAAGIFGCATARDATQPYQNEVVTIGDYSLTREAYELGRGFGIKTREDAGNLVRNFSEFSRGVAFSANPDTALSRASRLSRGIITEPVLKRTLRIMYGRAIEGDKTMGDLIYTDFPLADSRDK